MAGLRWTGVCVVCALLSGFAALAASEDSSSRSSEAVQPHDPSLIHTIHKALHFVSTLKSHLQNRGVRFQERDENGQIVRSRRSVEEESAGRRSRFTAKQKDHAMSILMAMDDRHQSGAQLRRKEVLRQALRYEPRSVLTILPARGRPTAQGCRVTFAMDELDGKPDDAVRHARLHLPCNHGDCQPVNTDDVTVHLSPRMQRKCIQRKSARSGSSEAQGTESERLRRSSSTSSNNSSSSNSNRSLQSYSTGWSALDITQTIQDIHPCDTQKAELYLSGVAMENVDCFSVVFLLTSTQTTALSHPHGNMSELSHAEIDAIADNTQQLAELDQRRKRRDLSLTPCICQLRTCNISFHRLDWLFVVFPLYLDIKTCRGSCLPLTQFPSDATKPPTVTNHVVMRNWYRIKVGADGGRVSPPQCVPVRYESASIGYALNDHEPLYPHTLKMETLPQIVANKCGCR